MKKCSKCHKSLSKENFYKNPNHSDGLFSCCKVCHNVCAKKYRDKNDNKERMKIWVKEFRKKDNWKEKNKEYLKKYRQTQKYKDYTKQYTSMRNKSLKGKEYNKKYIKNKIENNIQFKIEYEFRHKFREAFINNYKKGYIVDNIGCTIPELKIYLENKFISGMTWKNYGLTGWHVDHIIPMSSFNLINKKQLLKAIHYTNLQPLWALDNIKKSNKIL